MDQWKDIYLTFEFIIISTLLLSVGIYDWVSFQPNSETGFDKVPLYHYVTVDHNITKCVRPVGLLSQTILQRHIRFGKDVYK